MNIIILLLELILSNFILLKAYKKYKYKGIYIFSIIITIILSILSLNTIEVYNLEISSNIIFSAVLFTISSILVQKKGPEEIKKLLSIIVYSSVIVYSIIVLSVCISSSTINEITNNSYNLIFNLNNRLFFANIISLLISIYINSKLYHQIRQIKNKIWISSTLSMIITQIIECFLFSFIGYIFKIPTINVIEILVIRYVFKFIICIINTFSIYIINND